MGAVALGSGVRRSSSGGPRSTASRLQGLHRVPSEVAAGDGRARSYASTLSGVARTKRRACDACEVRPAQVG